MSETVFLNGRFIPREDAKIPADDRGFIFADGVYEVTKYYNGKPFRMVDHIKRLERSLRELEINYSGTEQLPEIFAKLIKRNNFTNKQAGVYVQISRGSHKRIHSFPENILPTIYAFAFEMPSPAGKLKNGIKVITHDDIRWQRCDIKSVSLLPNTMLFNRAVENGAGECILIRDGWVTEATHSSVIAVKNGTVVTRPLSNLILPGITRKVILEICAENKINIEERLFSKDELFEMDEVIIAGTGSEITPAVEIDKQIIGNKKPGEVTRFLQNKFFEKV